MIKPLKVVIAGAAVAGLLAGSMAVRTYAANASTKAGTALQTVADDEKESIPVKGKTSAKAKAGTRAATTVARAKTLAKAKAVAPPTEANLKRANRGALIS